MAANHSLNAGVWQSRQRYMRFVKKDSALKNKFDLTRHIPAEVKREVRRNCGFGCAICGSAFYHYEHYNPEFNEANEHNANGITLLCAQHHDAKTRGRISTETIINAAANPKCKQEGFSYGPLEFGIKSSIVQIGSTLFLDSRNIIYVNGEPVLSIKPPEEDNGPFLLTLVTEDSHNSNRIVDNEWIGDAQSWDITTEGRSIIVRDQIGKILLELENIPRVRFVLRQINITYRNFKIITKNIKQKEFDGILVPEEKILTITNPLEREIARIGASGGGLNEIKWENALEIIGNYMNPVLENVNIKGGNINLLCNDKSPMRIVGNTFESVKLNLGIDIKVEEFIEETNALLKDFTKVNKNKYRISPKRRAKLKNNYNILRYTSLINQLTKKDREFISEFIRKL